MTPGSSETAGTGLARVTLLDSTSGRRLQAGLRRARAALLEARTAGGYWTGELSNSALSTATAVIALAVVEQERSAPPLAGEPGIENARLASAIAHGLRWLADHANKDGGWGDTTQSLSNISTTALVWAAFGAVTGSPDQYAAVVERAEGWLAGHTRVSMRDESKRGPSSTCEPDNKCLLSPALSSEGGEGRDTKPSLTPAALARAVVARYGKDRTFSVPILTACALCGRLGPGSEAWRWVMPLPFELAAFPPSWYAALRLPVVSYALPALIAIGYARHFHLPPRNPLKRRLRDLARNRVLAKLEAVQPSSGGFLEATPLTSFVVMSLAGSGLIAHTVVAKGTEFLLKSQRSDGCWPIDTDLATWVTTLAVNALESLDKDSVCCIRDWLLQQQSRAEHPYTHAAAGGWAWTNLPGGVPDADDTAGALLALSRLRTGPGEAYAPEVLEAAQAGVIWLLDVQNRDGGIPTFCRGWGTLPFDRSSPDLTAHALRAWLAWLEPLSPMLGKRVSAALERALRFLERTQRTDGAWIPLWFGNEHAPGQQNPTYGTSRVARALCDAHSRLPLAGQLLARAVAWLINAQAQDGGWSGAENLSRSSVEETALAVEALGASLSQPQLPPEIEVNRLRRAVLAGTEWLLSRVESNHWTRPSPIGFYFANLWYHERLYPQVFTVAALEQVHRLGSA